MTALAAWPRAGYLPVVPPAPEDDTAPAPGEGDPGELGPAWATIPDGTGINQILGVGNRLILAHGGYVGGSHHVATVDTATRQPQSGPLVPTEGFSTAHHIDGVVYLTWNDPTGAWNAPQGYSYSTDGGETWREKRVAPSYHFYDMCKHDGALFLAGSGPAPDGTPRGIVWRSDDAGVTWVESLSVAGADLVRVYYLAEYGGALRCAPRNASPATTYRWDQGHWTEEAPSRLTSLTKIRLGCHGLSAGGCYYGPENALTPDGQLLAYDGDRRTPAWSDGQHVYAVNLPAGKIDRTPLGLADWAPWLDLGEGMTGHVATCAALHDGWVYVGGTQGRIWRYPAPT